LVVDFDTTVNSSPTDISGKGNHGVLHNSSGAPSYSPADKAFNFSGVSGVIWAGVLSPVMTGDRICSMSCWFKTDDASQINQTVMWLGAYSASGLLAVIVSNGALRVSIGDTCRMDVAGVIESNTWYHVVGIKAAAGAISTSNFSSTFKLYLNGEPMTGTFGGGTRTLNVTTNYLYIGAGNATGAEIFRGKISNPKLYDTVLEASEVKKLYNLGRTGRSMVISDTAVGIGKVPEAQLDVRGNLNVDGVIKSNSPAFSAYEYDGYTATGGNTYVTLGNTFVNKGGCYDTSNGIFTAPISGTYRFTVDATIRSPGDTGTSGGTGATTITLYINNVNWNPTSTGRPLIYQVIDPGTNHQHVSGSLVWNLNAGDTVRIYLITVQSNSDINWGEGYGRFMGYLIS